MIVVNLYDETLLCQQCAHPRRRNRQYGHDDFTLAAKRSGIKEIILSAKNKRDIDEIEKHYLKGLIFHYVDTVDEVLKVALMKDTVKQQMKFTFSEIKALA